MSRRSSLSFADAPAIVIFLALLAYIIAGTAETLGNDIKWQPAERMTASIGTETLSGIAIPAVALQTDSEGAYVWVISANIVEKKNINIIHAEGGLILAEEEGDLYSLRPGDKLICSGSGIYEGKILT